MSDPERSMRVINAIGSGAAFAAITAVLFSILRCRDIGHRLLLWVVFLACFIRAAANFLGAWEVYFHGTLSWDVWVYLVTSVTSCIMGGVLFTARPDIIITLRTSEAQDRIRADRLADLQMAQWNLEYISLTTRNQSEALRREQLESMASRL